MAIAIESGLELSAILFWVIWFALLTIIIWIAYGFEQALAGFSIPGVGNPFKSLANDLAKYVSEPVDRLRKNAEKGIVKGFNGLVQSLELLVGLYLLLGLAQQKALAYLWNHALVPLVKFVGNTLLDAALDVKGRITAAIYSGATAVVAAGLRAEGWVTALVVKYARLAIHDALAIGGAINSEIAALDTKLHHEVTVAIRDVEGYADTAVHALRKAEDAALAGAVSVLHAGIVAAEKAATEEFHAAEREAAAALAGADATINAAIAGVKSIAVTLEDDLGTLLGKLSPADVAALLAAIPLLGLLVNTIATESGLNNSECRSKVKGICGTNPLQWAGLLAGIAAIGVSFDLADILKASLAVYSETEGLIADIGHLAEHEVEEIGVAIGQAALALAA